MTRKFEPLITTLNNPEVQNVLQDESTLELLKPLGGKLTAADVESLIADFQQKVSANYISGLKTTKMIAAEAVFSIAKRHLAPLVEKARAINAVISALGIETDIRDDLAFGTMTTASLNRDFSLLETYMQRPNVSKKR